MPWRPVLTMLIAVVATACAGRPPAGPQPIDALLGGARFTGPLHVQGGEHDAVTVSNTMLRCPPPAADGGVRCLTMTIDLDGTPPNFFLAQWLDLESFRAAMIKEVGFAQAMRVPALAGGTFSLVGARTRTACEALRATSHLPGFGSDYVGDAGCRPVLLTVD